jgi:hypothetical protein
MEKLQRDVRLLKAYALVVTMLLGALVLAGFSQSSQKTRFTEIDVERINIIEKDDKLKWSFPIANANTRASSMERLFRGRGRREYFFSTRRAMNAVD